MCFFILGLHWHKLVQCQSKICVFPFPIRILRSATRSISRLNYSIPPLAGLCTEDEPDLEPLISAAPSDCKYHPHTSTAHLALEEISKCPLAVQTSSQEATLLQIGYITPAVASIRQPDAVFSSSPSDFFVSSGFWLGRGWSGPGGRGGVGSAMRTDGVSLLVDVSLLRELR